MKMTRLLPVLFIALIALSFVGKEKHKTLAIGQEAPMKEAKLKDVSGKEISLSDLKLEEGICVIFSANTCPFVVGSEGSNGWEGRYEDIALTCKKYKIGMTLVNSNAAKRGGEDSFEAMKKRAIEKNYQSTYLLDLESKMANAFGAKTTPHVFLFDSDFKLIYKGAIDDNMKNAEMISESFLLDAIDSLIDNEEVIPAETKAVGCSIKRVSK